MRGKIHLLQSKFSLHWDKISILLMKFVLFSVQLCIKLKYNTIIHFSLKKEGPITDGINQK